MRDVRMLIAALLLPGSALVATAIAFRVLLRSVSASGRLGRHEAA
jgi:hypothetical protein